MWAPEPDHPLRRLFAAFTEQTFLHELGVGDPPLVDYLSMLLSQFIHKDALYRLHNAKGERLEQVAEIAHEMQHEDEGELRHLRPMEAARGGEHDLLR